MDAAIATGKVKWLNAFDTILPERYAPFGFKAVARLKFNPEYQPDGWSVEQYSRFNNGQPDVVFMRYTGQPESYESGDGVYVDSYDEAVSLVLGETRSIRFRADEVASRFKEIQDAPRGEGDPVRGSPDLANLSGDEDVRDLVDAVDELRGRPQPVSFDDLKANAEARIQADFEGEKNKLFVTPPERLTAEDVFVAKRIASQVGLDAIRSGDNRALGEAAHLIFSYRQNLTEAARTLAAARDEWKTPQERLRIVVEAMLTNHQNDVKKTISGIKRARAALEKEGIDLDEILTPGSTTLNDPKLAARALRIIQAAQANFSDKFYEFWINRLLLCSPLGQSHLNLLNDLCQVGLIPPST
jgi:hypothetical protein